jgi:hypothetical protein
MLVRIAYLVNLITPLKGTVCKANKLPFAPRLGWPPGS